MSLEAQMDGISQPSYFKVNWDMTSFVGEYFCVVFKKWKVLF